MRIAPALRPQAVLKLLAVLLSPSGAGLLDNGTAGPVLRVSDSRARPHEVVTR